MNAPFPQAVTWLASYPRSGNTYLRTLIANYFSGLDRALTLDELMLSTWGEHVEEIWQELTGKPPVERSHAEEFAARLAYFERLRARCTNPVRLFKTHTPNVLMDGKPAFVFFPGDRVIHVVRHPCDVAISFAHYFGIDIDEAIRRITMADTCHVGHPNLGHELIGSWSQHTRSWMADGDLPVLRLRYFDLVNDVRGSLLRIVSFLGHEPNPRRIEQTVDFARFERMQKQESATGFGEHSGNGSQSFFRTGRPGQWTGVLSVDQARRVLAADPALVDQLGFMQVFLS